MFRLNQNKQKTNQKSLIGSIFLYFLQKIQSFSGFFVFQSFFSVFSVCFETVCFGCFASIPKQRVSMFRLNRNKQKTHPNSLREYIWLFFRKFSVVSVCYETVLFVSVVLIQVRNTETNRIILFLVSRNKPKQTRNRSCFGLFRFEPKFIFVCFEDTLTASLYSLRTFQVHLRCSVIPSAPSLRYKHKMQNQSYTVTFTDPKCWGSDNCCGDALKSFCSSPDGVHLGPERTLADEKVFQYGSIDTSLHPPLFQTVPLQGG